MISTTRMIGGGIAAVLIALISLLADEPRKKPPQARASVQTEKPAEFEARMKGGVREEIFAALKKETGQSDAKLAAMLGKMKTSDPRALDDGKGLLVVTLLAKDKQLTSYRSQWMVEDVVDAWKESHRGRKVIREVPVRGLV